MGQALTARRAAALTISLALVATLVVAVRSPASAAALCATPARDGSPTISGVVNTYFAGSANAAAGATSVTVAAHAAGDANTAIATGDMLLVIQMQGATINTTNTSSYGDGSGSGTGAISTTAGLYEYVVAAGNLATGGGSVTIQGRNGGGLVNSYTTGGAAHFQVIRVPQYASPTMGAALTALAWNGTAGGVLAIDASNILLGNGATVSVDAKGFRGGQGRGLTGDNTAGNGDWVNVSTKNAHGAKGEGTAGTPGYVYNGAAGVTTTDTYPVGDTARGAPGNAGGGGADSSVALNQENSGGGGGGNGGAGGVGGKTWQGNLPYGGHGGTFTPTQSQLVMGGGGGAGSRNNGGGLDSSGGVGGGIVMMRFGGISGALTVTANGGMGVDPQNDGGGGGGAGGSVIITSAATINNVTVTANGANGTDADVLNAGGQAHGPGGGGGGGVEIDSGGISAHTVNGGAAGVTDGSPLPDAHYGAAAGSAGSLFGYNYVNVPGASSGAECGSSTGTVFIGPVGAPTATGSYDGSVLTTNDNDFVEKSFAPPAFNAINSSSVVGAPNGNTYTAAVTGIAVRHEVRNTAGAAGNFIFYAQAPSGPGAWTVAIYNDNAGSLGTQLAGTASGTAYQTSATVAIPSNGSYFVWTVYAAPTGLQAFNRFDAFIAVVDAGNISNNNEVHDELYTGFIVQTKSYVVTAHNCAAPPPAGGWCPGATLKYTVDVRNVAVGTSGTEPAGALLSAGTLVLTDDGTNLNSWAKDGGYMNTPGVTSTGTAPTTVTYYFTGGPNTTFPVNYTTTQKVTKFTAQWTALAAAQNSQVIFSVIQF